MPTVDDIVEQALMLSHRAADELAGFIGTAWAELDEADILLAQLAAAKEGTEDPRRGWERHAALHLLLAASVWPRDVRHRRGALSRLIRVPGRPALGHRRSRRPAPSGFPRRCSGPIWAPPNLLPEQALATLALYGPAHDGRNEDWLGPVPGLIRVALSAGAAPSPGPKSRPPATGVRGCR